MGKATWTVDPAHSSIGFSVRHMMVSKVKGQFRQFDASIEADPEDLTTADISFSIDVNSIDTGNQDRDNHLKAPDFFDAQNHPKITFKSTKIVSKGDGVYDVTGDLTIRGVTRPVTFKVTYGGQGKNPCGAIVAGFSGEGKINRTEFGLTWNTPLETGGVLVSEDVDISFDIEVKKEE